MPISQAEQWFLFWTPAETSDKSPEWPNWTNRKTRSRRTWDNVVAVTSYPMKRNGILDDRLDVPEPIGVTVSPAEDKIAEQLEFDETDVFELFEKKN